MKPRERRLVAERFMDNVYPEPNTGCWLWGGAVAGKGYGVFWLVDRQTYAHRAALKIFRNEEAGDLHVLHSCDVHCCVNPDHLRIGTHADNMRDAATRHRMRSGDRHHTALLPETVRRGEKHHSARLTAESVAAIRAMSGTRKQIGDLYGISPGTVSDIKNGRTWRHL